MTVEKDLRKLSNSDVVFSVTNFMTSDYWHDQEEAALWDDHVLVSFQ